MLVGLVRFRHERDWLRLNIMVGHEVEQDVQLGLVLANHRTGSFDRSVSQRDTTCLYVVLLIF